MMNVNELVYKDRQKNWQSNSSQKIRVLSNFKDFLNLILIWSMLTSAAPFMFFSAIPGHPYKILIAVGLAITSLFLLAKGKVKIPDKIIIFILISQTFLIVFPFSFFHGQFHQLAYIAISLQYLATLVLYVYVHNFYPFQKMVKSLIYLMSLMVILGAIAFVLGLMGKIEVFSIHENIGNGTAYNFILTYSNTITVIGKSIIIRVASFFDEPGTFAYFITFTLLINKIYGFSQKMEWILIVGGICTLSLAFYITIILYLILFYGNWKKFKYFFLGLVIISSLFLYINNSRYDSPNNAKIYELTIGRTKQTQESDKIVSGDNRSELFAIAFEAFIDSPIIGQGIGYREDVNGKYYKIYFGANLFSPLAQGGIIGFTITFLPFFYWTYLVFVSSNSRNKGILISSWTIVAVNFLQRPEVQGFFTYFVIILLIESTKFYLKNTSQNRDKLRRI
jgi:hypothetical protein